jgi:hypothetical protein
MDLLLELANELGLKKGDFLFEGEIINQTENRGSSPLYLQKNQQLYM